MNYDLTYWSLYEEMDRVKCHLSELATRLQPLPHDFLPRDVYPVLTYEAIMAISERERERVRCVLVCIYTI